MEQEYFIHEVIVSNSKGKLFYYHSDTMNENFSYDKEYDELSPIEEEQLNDELALARIVGVLEE